MDHPKIAIAVYVENAGFGASWAAPIASLMIEQYIKGKVLRKNVEDYLLSFKQKP
jgi:penicillin-binding protein 2